MSQNNHKDFENQGWEAMFQTLEREMPVKKKRRGAFWLWLSVGTVLLAGSAFLYAKRAEKSTESFTKQAKSIVYDNNFSKKTDTIKAIAMPITPTTTTFGNLPKLPESKTTMPTTEKTSLGILPKIHANSIVPTATIPTNTVFEQLPQLTKSKIQVTENIELLNPAKNTPLSITLDSSLKIDFKPAKSRIISPTKEENKLHWGITTGIHTKQIQDLDGYHAGLIVVKPLSEKRLLSTGLSFRQTKMEQQNPITSYIERIDQFSPIGTTNALQKAQPISVDKLYYLDMPFTIDYKITKKWAVSSGIKLSYLVGQKTTTKDTSVFLVKSAYNSLNFAVLNDISPSSLGLNRWDAAVLGGIQYLPTRHIQLGLRYDFGLFNNINRVGKSAYNRYVGLNAVYWF